MSRIIVVGAGAIGSALAYRLAAAGAAVTLLEARDVAGGTSSATFSMTIAARKTPRHHFDLAVAGAAEHRRLAHAVGGRSWLHEVAAYEWATGDHDTEVVTGRVARLQEWGYPVEWIDGRGLLEAEPYLTVDPQETGPVAVYPQELWFDAPLMTRTLVAAAERAGASVHIDSPVTAVDRCADRVVARTRDGQEHEGDAMVICAGPRSDEVARLAGCTIAVRGIPGLVVTSKPIAPRPLNGIVLLPQINLRPGPAGTVVAHSYTEEANLPQPLESPAESPSTRRVVDHATRLLPAYGRAGVGSARVGIRPVPFDGLPIAGWLDDRQQIYTVTAHSGIALAPALSLFASAEILGGPEEPDLASLRPHRRGLRDPDTAAVDESTREMNRMFAAGAR
ncbi:MAG: NAD(P)/FAD-dependent oxidoreductase [Nocardioidaceae bacterium]